MQIHFLIWGAPEVLMTVCPSRTFVMADAPKFLMHNNRHTNTQHSVDDRGGSSTKRAEAKHNGGHSTCRLLLGLFCLF